MIVCAARPGMGKTALALNIMENLVIKYKKPVGFFSLEMSNSEIMDRLLSSHSHIPLNKIRTGCLDDFEYRVLKDKVAQIRNSLSLLMTPLTRLWPPSLLKRLE